MKMRNAMIFVNLYVAHFSEVEEFDQKWKVVFV